MGSCSSNKQQNGNGDSGFNPGNGGEGFNPGNESHRPHSRQAGNMAPTAAEQGPNADVAAENGSGAPQENAAPNPMGNLASPVMGGLQDPQAPQMEMPPQANEPQNTGAQGGWHRGNHQYVDPQLHGSPSSITGRQLIMNNGLGGFQADAQPMDQGLPPQAGFQHHDNNLIIGAVSADVSDGAIVQEGHWEEFEAANNVMLLEDFHASMATSL